MPRLACPGCKNPIPFSEAERGQVVACSGCGKKFRAPAKPAAVAVGAAPAGKPPAPKPAATPAKPSAPLQKAAIKNDAVIKSPKPPPIQEDGEMEIGDRLMDETPFKKPDEDDAIDLGDQFDGEDAPKKPADDSDAIDVDDQIVDDEPPAKPAPKTPKGKKPPADDEEDEAPKKPAKKRKALAADDDDAEDDGGDDKPKKKKKKKKRRRRVSTTTGVLGGIGSLLFLGIFVLIISGKWVDVVWGPLEEFLEEKGIPKVVAITITGLLLAIPSAFFYVWMTKSSILEAMPEDLDFREADPESFEDLDRKRLDKLTKKIETIGFTHLTDYTVKPDIDLGNKGFARLFVHEEKHVFAEINQAFVDGGDATPMRCNFISYLDDGWSISVTDRTPTKESYLMRRPRACWISLAEDSVEDLVAELLKIRKKMARDLEVEVIEEHSEEDYFSHEKEATRDRKDAVRARWALGICIEFWMYDHSPKREWMGEYDEK